MEKDEPAEKTRDDYRRLPPRISPDEMTTMQPVEHAVDDPTNGDDDQWHIRRGWTA
ncbi:hypothetical protein AB0368_02645 [Actinoplanes sp. NPDC051475]|uniref:hypothetical protein n=1 Tax=Actinoplanes sp. NPDC051475 TaxID=3157225 RepID=UPI00344F6E88